MTTPFNRDSKRCHRKLVARANLKADIAGRTRAEEADRESRRACWRATVVANDTKFVKSRMS